MHCEGLLPLPLQPLDCIPQMSLHLVNPVGEPLAILTHCVPWIEPLPTTLQLNSQLLHLLQPPLRLVQSVQPLLGGEQVVKVGVGVEEGVEVLEERVELPLLCLQERKLSPRGGPILLVGHRQTAQHKVREQGSE